jgi:hypothetical protein
MNVRSKRANPLSLPSNAWWSEADAAAASREIFAQVVLRLIDGVI